MRDIENLGAWCVRMLKLAMVVEALFFVHSFSYLIQLLGIDVGANPSQFANLVDTLGLVVIGIYLVVLLACYIMSGRWIYRASFNAGMMAQAGGDRVSPGWAVGWFFIPIANLFKPFQAMRQTWNSTFSPTKDINSPVESALGWWWGAWIISNILGQISYRAAVNGSFDGLKISTYTDLINFPITVVSIYFFMRIIQAVTAAQTHDNIHETFA